MPVETGDEIQDLNPDWPAGTEPKSQGDDHLRKIKQAVKTSLPNMTGPWTTTSNIAAAAATADEHLVTFGQLPKMDGGTVNSNGTKAGGYGSWTVVKTGTGSSAVYEITFTDPATSLYSQSLTASGIALNLVATCFVTLVSTTVWRVQTANAAGTIFEGGFFFQRVAT